MSKTIDFYFDFSSSYSYVAHKEIQALAEKFGRTVNWKPIALGAIFKAHGHAPPVGDSPKSSYIAHDVERSAAMNGLPYRWPKPFPFNSMSAARIFWYLADKDQDQALKWAFAVFDASMGQGKDCSNAEVLGEIAESLGHDRGELLEAVNRDEVKEMLKTVTGEAMEKGVFGAPTYFVDGEMFWGADRLQQIEQRLGQGN